MKRILVVGQAFSDLTRYLLENGYDYTFLADKKRNHLSIHRTERTVYADFSTRQTIVAAAKALSQPIDGAIATYEGYILATAWIAEALAIPGLPPQAAEACTDKAIMRRLFAKAPIPISPGFSVVENEASLHAFARNHDFPLILKPANLAKSLLVTKNHSLGELLKNYRRAQTLIGELYSKYAQNRQPKLIVEEFLQGNIHSVDAFTDSDGQVEVLEQVVDYQTGYDIGFDDNFHYSRLLPSRLSPNEQQELRHCAEIGIKALGIKSSPSHVEIIMTKKGPRIVEIGARNGGYRERMHRLANGIDITKAAIEIALGEKPYVKASRNDCCAVLELFPKTPGIYTDISHRPEAERLASLVSLNVKSQKLNTFVGKAADGYKACAIIVLHNANTTQFMQDLDFINNNVRILTKPATTH